MPRQATLLATTALTGVLLACPAFISTVAQAADLPVKAAPSAPPPFSWTGVYLGAHAGYSWGDVDITCTFGCERNQFASPKPAGALFGIQAGANFQTGMWVWGVESDFSKMLAKDTAQFPSIDMSKATDQLTSRYDWLGTVRARGGIATGPALWYATGGFAAANVSHAYHLGLGESAGFTQSRQHVRLGWTAGAGVEYAFQPNWSVKLEYLHVKLQDTQLGIQQDDGFNANLRFRNEFDLVRAGINVRILPP